MADLSVMREEDGDMSFEIYLDSKNLISVSVHKTGVLNWAGGIDGEFMHGNVPSSPLGLLLFGLIERAAVSEEADQ